MKPCRKSRNDWESRQCKFDIFASSLYININEIKHTTPRTGNVFLGFVCHIHWRLFVISTDDCLSYPLTTVCHIYWRLFVISTDDCLSYPLTTVCHIYWRLFVISTDDCLSYPLTTVCHIYWRLFVISTDDCFFN
jgi:hypothetical protein